MREFKTNPWDMVSRKPIPPKLPSIRNVSRQKEEKQNGVENLSYFLELEKLLLNLGFNPDLAKFLSIFLVTGLFCITIIVWLLYFAIY